MAAPIGQGIQNPPVTMVDQGTLVIAQGAADDVATVQSDVSSLDGRVAAIEALVAPAYAGVYESNEAGTNITLTSNASFYQWVSGVPGTVVGAPVLTVAGSQITVGASGEGLYALSCHFSGTLGAANELKAAIFVGAIEQGHLRIDQDVSNLAKYVPGAITGFLRLVEGDIVSLRFSSDTNTQTFTMKHANLSIHRIDL